MPDGSEKPSGDLRSTRRSVLSAGLAVPLLGACAAREAGLPYRLERPDAPFAMPAIEVPDFSNSERFPITDFGASQSDQQATTRAIAQAIAAAHAAGSGTVVIPEGTWPTGKVHLKSNVNLHLSRGATLLFSSQPADYLPPVRTSWEGLECFNYSPLVYAYECENVAITGEGRLEAKLDIWRDWYARPPAHMQGLVDLYMMAVRGVLVSERDMTRSSANLRPQFIQFNRCRRVLVEGISIENSPFWTIHPYLCRDVVIRRVSVRAHGHNNDGVDPEMSENVLIEHCTFDQGDDAIAIKAGREFDGWTLASPTRNIVMRHCRVKNGHQLCAIGSELSGGIENVHVHDCHFEQGEIAAPVPIHNILFIKTNERRGGFVRNIFLSDVSATSSIEGGILAIETDVLYQWRDLVPTYKRRLTPIENIQVSNVTVEQAEFLCRIEGEAEQPVANVILRNNRIGTIRGEPVVTEHVENLQLG